MPSRLEIALQDHLTDPEGEGIRKKSRAYFGIEVSCIRAVQILTIDAGLSADQLELIRNGIFTNPVTQVSSDSPLAIDCDWVIWVGYRPGVRDNPGATAVEAIEDLLRVRLAPGEAVYTSKRYCVSGRDLSREDVQRIAGGLLPTISFSSGGSIPPANGTRPRGSASSSPRSASTMRRR